MQQLPRLSQLPLKPVLAGPVVCRAVLRFNLECVLLQHARQFGTNRQKELQDVLNGIEPTLQVIRISLPSDLIAVHAQFPNGAGVVASSAFRRDRALPPAPVQSRRSVAHLTGTHEPQFIEHGPWQKRGLVGFQPKPVVRNGAVEPPMVGRGGKRLETGDHRFGLWVCDEMAPNAR